MLALPTKVAFFFWVECVQRWVHIGQTKILMLRGCAIIQEGYKEFVIQSFDLWQLHKANDKA